MLTPVRNNAGGEIKAPHGVCEMLQIATVGLSESCGKKRRLGEN